MDIFLLVGMITWEEDGPVPRAAAVPPTRSGFCLVALEPLQLLEREVWVRRNLEVAVK